MKGAINDTCHPVTGQCPCMESVVGRQCNQCESPYAGITLQEKEEGCKGNNITIYQIIQLICYENVKLGSLLLIKLHQVN